MSGRYEVTKKKYLLDHEFEHLEKTLSRFYEKDPRNVTLIQLAMYTGARASELLNITVNDLDPAEKTVFIFGLKKSDNRELPVYPWLFKQLQALTPAADGRLFPICYRRLAYIWDNYRPVKKTFHALRHTFAVRQYRKNKDLRLLQVALGHRNWNNTMIYAKYHYTMVELRRAMLR